MDETTRNKKRSFTFSEEMTDKLEQLAKHNDRSLTGMIEQLIKQEWKRMKNERLSL